MTDTTKSDLVQRLRESADEVMKFPHPSQCDHLHIAHHVMRESADEIERLRAQLEAAQADAARWQRALHEIAEEWAGAECGEPVYAQEAYAIGLAKRMYTLAAEAMQAEGAA
jgi:hypothetical protein